VLCHDRPILSIRSPATRSELIIHRFACRPFLAHSAIDHRTAAYGQALPWPTLSGDTVTMWDITNRLYPARIATLTGDTGLVVEVVFGSDEHTLATISDNGTAVVWDLRELLTMSDHVIELSCTAAGGGLTQWDWERVAPGIPYRPTCREYGFSQ
jgi:WD40 repeat protein